MSNTSKVSFSIKKHILPPLLGIVIMLIVLGGLNSQLIVANIIQRVNASDTKRSVHTNITNTKPANNSPDTLQIPQLNITAPIVDEPSHDDKDIQLALQKGIVHYGTTAYPGQKGNVVLVGHSSGQIWIPGDYKFVFTLLDTIQREEHIILDYKGTRYVYSVTETKVVPPTDFSVIQPTSSPRLTLITCTPVGTDKDRLVVIAKQIIPDPKTATSLDEKASHTTSTDTLPR